MILPFSAMDFAKAQVDNKNPKDKIMERLQEKNIRDTISQKQSVLGNEDSDLKKKIKSETRYNEKQELLIVSIK